MLEIAIIAVETFLRDWWRVSAGLVHSTSQTSTLWASNKKLKTSNKDKVQECKDKPFSIHCESSDEQYDGQNKDDVSVVLRMNHEWYGDFPLRERPSAKGHLQPAGSLSPGGQLPDAFQPFGERLSSCLA